MFSRATRNFVCQIDPEGSLIHVSRLNDSHKLVPMALVVKRNRFWFWQRPKYQPSDFTLSDLLQGSEPLTPVVSETDFLTYTGAFGDNHRGTLDAKAGVVSVSLEGQGFSKLQSSFGKLKREQVDVKKLLGESRERLVDMKHVLVLQLERRAEVLAVLKERVLTTSPCSITQTRQEQGSCGGVLGLVGGVLGSSVEVCVKENGSMDVDSDVSMEIPPNTVIAYSLLELEIKNDGHYEPCLQPGTLGGFEADSGTSSPSHDSFDLLDMVDGVEGVIPEGAPLSVLHNEELEKTLRPLADLPQSTRHLLFQNFREVLGYRAALSDLEDVLEEWCRAEAPVTCELLANQNSSEHVLLDLLRPTNPANHIDTCGLATPHHLTAAHLLVSAMEVLPDAALGLLKECSTDVLMAFNMLMTRLKLSCESLLVDSLPLPLRDEQVFDWVEQLLSSTNVRIRREAGRLWAETGRSPGVLPLVLCVTVQGLATLCAGQE